LKRSPGYRRIHRPDRFRQAIQIVLHTRRMAAQNRKLSLARSAAFEVLLNAGRLPSIELAIKIRA
jgi:hypothetical protein